MGGSGNSDDGGGGVGGGDRLADQLCLCKYGRNNRKSHFLHCFSINILFYLWIFISFDDLRFSFLCCQPKNIEVISTKFISKTVLASVLQSWFCKR